MQAPRALRDWLYPTRGALTRIEFQEGRWLAAFVPDDEVFGLARELILQRVYVPPGGFPAGTVIDAGAHVGLFSLIAAQYARKVIAVEASPINHRIIELNAELNQLDNVTVLHRALWKEEREMSFDASWHSTGGHLSDSGSVSVRSVTLDSLIEEHGAIDLLKLDIERAELGVLPETARLREVRTILAELHLHDGESALDDLCSHLDGLGFDVELIPTAALYKPREARTVIRNWRLLRGQLLVKLGVLAYLLAPIKKPRRPPGSWDMPLLVAQRRDDKRVEPA